jgi:hypothetical protein
MFLKRMENDVTGAQRMRLGVFKKLTSERDDACVNPLAGGKWTTCYGELLYQEEREVADAGEMKDDVNEIKLEELENI